jgi:hypothetical protein
LKKQSSESITNDCLNTEDEDAKSDELIIKITIAKYNEESPIMSKKDEEDYFRGTKSSFSQFPILRKNSLSRGPILEHETDIVREVKFIEKLSKAKYMIDTITKEIPELEKSEEEIEHQIKTTRKKLKHQDTSVPIQDGLDPPQHSSTPLIKGKKKALRGLATVGNTPN